VLREQADYNFPDFSPTALELWTRDDAVYGVPFSTSPFIVYYNADLFEQAGLETPRELAAKGEWTWDALAAAAKTISEQTPGVYGFVGKDAERAYTDRVWQTLIPQLRAYGTDLWNEAGECTLASPEAVTAISRYHQMIFADKSVVPPGEQADFFAGQAAMTINQLSRAVTLAEAPFAWDIAPLPAGPAGQPYIIGQAAFGAFNNSKNPELARDFVAFVTDPQNVRKLAQFYPPARVSVLDSGAIAEANPKIDPAAIDVAIVAGIKQGAVLPSHPEWSKIDLAARAELDNLWLPDADPAAVLPAVCEAITPLLHHQPL
jgi:multiple sugar transport system substrate-binding protein